METTETLQALRAQQERQGRIAAETKARRGIYLQFNECIDLIPNAESLRNIVRDHFTLVMDAPGSTGNHQAWQGGYVDHVTETMNIATQMYFKFEELRGLPFVLSDPLVVLYLHDLEKPWKHFLPLSPDTCLCGHRKADHWRSNAWSDGTMSLLGVPGKGDNLYGSVPHRNPQIMNTQQGFIVLTLDEYKEWHAEMVNIHRGTAFFRGRMYSAVAKKRAMVGGR